MPLDDPHPGSRKQREIRFDGARPGQVAEAMALLLDLERLQVREGQGPNSLTVEYEIVDFTLQGLETALVRQGFHLDHSVYAQLSRAVIYFCEETQLRNLSHPERLLKKSHEVYSKAWERHPHGDRDETPPDLRNEK
ncbi:hypothetical protein B9N43_10930 [Denitratisoma sp. DHT3]|nr:hypothetical protein B9N43_10930 [Denitratisoma sp. DHT3]